MTLREHQEQHDATFIPFSDAELVESFGEYEAEYAAIRKGVGIFHEPQRGLLQLTGKDCKDFLNRMGTQDINGMTGGQSKRGFQLNGKGRITADVIVHHGDESTWLEGDACDLDELAEFLDSRLFGEDVSVEQITTQRVKLTLHGPQTSALLLAVGGDGADAAMDMPGTHHVISLAGEKATVYRRDDCGSPGAHIWARVEHVDALYEALVDAVGGLVPDVDQSEGAKEGQGTRRPIVGRGIGWLAFNTARIEAGTPLYHVDFGPDSLPHETSLLDEAVSFTKGCYLGQEVVARLHNLGHPKRMLVGLKGKDEDRKSVV